MTLTLTLTLTPPASGSLVPRATRTPLLRLTPHCTSHKGYDIDFIKECTAIEVFKPVGFPYPITTANSLSNSPSWLLILKQIPP